MLLHSSLRRSGRLYKRPYQISSKENLDEIGEKRKKIRENVYEAAF
jgi:hypothetical protein